MFIFTKKMRNWYLSNYEKKGEKHLRLLRGDANNEKAGSKWTPLSDKKVSYGKIMEYVTKWNE